MDQRLRDAFEYYLAHQDEMVQKYNGRVVAIKDRRVLGDYEDRTTAIEETAKTEQLGTFIVQKVSPGEDDYTIRVNSAVVFR
jgi:hypothetical protein